MALIDVSSRTQKVRSRVTISGDFHTSYTYLATLLSTGISISDDSDRENVGGDHPGFSFIESFSYFPVSCVGCWWYKESLTLTLHIYVSNTRVCVSPSQLSTRHNNHGNGIIIVTDLVTKHGA